MPPTLHGMSTRQQEWMLFGDLTFRLISSKAILLGSSVVEAVSRRSMNKELTTSTMRSLRLADRRCSMRK